MKLGKLLQKLDYHFEDMQGGIVTDPAVRAALLDREITDITNDSRKVSEGGLFFCIVGANSDGHDFARASLGNGAGAIVIQHDVNLAGLDFPLDDPAACPAIIRVTDTRYAMAFIAAAWYGDPAKEMKIIGITGTKGKTTTTYMIRSILENAGIPTGLIGTIEIAYADKRIPAGNTTPESVVLQKTFRDMADAGMKAVVMEVSSQALMLHRTQGFLFDIGIFTNISPDHIGPNEHRDFEDYLSCKGLLFKQCRVGILNGDDPNTQAVLDGHTCSVETFGLSKDNDLYADDLKLIHEPGELGISFSTHGLIEMPVQVHLPGQFSVYNALSAIAVCRHFSVGEEMIKDALKKIAVRGRIEMVPVPGGYTLLIDYAHNAVALESILTTLRAYEPSRLICLFGCGGNRSKLRRYEMGEVSGKFADLTVITSDNPRFEDPLAIMEDIKTGIAKTDGQHVDIPDRKEAIRFAMHEAKPGDIVVLAGKGHEDYQEICGVKHPMDERVLIAEILREDKEAKGTE